MLVGFAHILSGEFIVSRVYAVSVMMELSIANYIMAKKKMVINFIIWLGFQWNHMLYYLCMHYWSTVKLAYTHTHTYV